MLESCGTPEQDDVLTKRDTKGRYGNPSCLLFPILLEANAGPGMGFTGKERGGVASRWMGLGEWCGREPAAELNFLS